MNRKVANKLLIVSGIVFFIAAFRYFELGQYLTLAYIKASQESFQSMYSENSLAVISGYMAIYILVTALSLPGAAVMTLAGGALFGLFAGTIIVSFASTIGATLACLAARFLLRDWVQEKFGDKLKTINDGIHREGSFYLFTMRLIPVFPFFMINLAMGLTKMRLRSFFWVSQLGMFAGTVVYVNAGKELAKIDTLAGILSPGLLFSFVLLGLFPITAKKLIALYRQRAMKTVGNSSSCS
ncbi:MAG: TVP38/TMEM64 family protein [Deltaproteobacteria bacterium]|nr:TVP38/TMEM64 family protein [Deltaproteobacteria bacterium]